MTTLRDELRDLVGSSDRVALPGLAGALAEAQALITARLQAQPVPEPTNHLLTAEEAGELLGMSAKWCYANKDLLGAVRLSHGAVRFPQVKLDSYMARLPCAS